MPPVTPNVVLIDLFGYKVNPEHIVRLEEYETKDFCGTKVYLSTEIEDKYYFQIKDQKPESVRTKINEQINEELSPP